MYTENYVSFETAKLLKEKGFDVWGDGSYNSGIEIYKEYSPSGSLNSCATSKPHIKGYPAPTLQMTMKWLREVHHIFLVVDYNYECTDKSYIYKVYHLGENGKPERFPVWGVSYDIEGNQHKEIVSYRNFELSYFDYATYEEAADEGIKYCLKNWIQI